MPSSSRMGHIRHYLMCRTNLLIYSSIGFFYLEAQYNSQCQPTVVILSTDSSELQIEVDLVSSEYNVGCYRHERLHLQVTTEKQSTMSALVSFMSHDAT